MDVSDLPFREFTESTGIAIDVQTDNPGGGLSSRGRYTCHHSYADPTIRNIQIVAVAERIDLAWCHELIHAAECLLGQECWDWPGSGEIVAWLGGLVLLGESDRLGVDDAAITRDAISHICRSSGQRMVPACRRMLRHRVPSAIKMILGHRLPAAWDDIFSMYGIVTRKPPS